MTNPRITKLSEQSWPVALVGLGPEITRTHFHLQELANNQHDLVTKAFNRELVGDELRQKLLERRISLETFAAVAFVVGNKNREEISQMIGEDNEKKVAFKIRSAIFDLLEAKERVGINRSQLKLNCFQYVEEIRKAQIFVDEIKKWVKKPTWGSLPHTSVHLPADKLEQNIPWLRGRKEQLLVALEPVFYERKISGAILSCPLFAWVDVDNSGKIILTVSAADKLESEEVKSNSLTPILGRFLIGAAANSLRGCDETVSKFDHASLLKSRTEAIIALRELYPDLPPLRIKPETMIMIGDGAVELTSLEEKRPLREVRTTVATKTNGLKISSTAHILLVSALRCRHPDPTNVKARRPFSYRTVGVGMPSALTFKRGFDTAKITVSAETLRHIARTGKFLGAKLEVKAFNSKAKKPPITIGAVLFNSRQKDELPSFVFESGILKKNAIETSRWIKLALLWMKSPSRSKPSGFLRTTLLHDEEKDLHYIFFRQRKIRLVKLPLDLEKVIIYPYKLLLEGKETRALFFYSNSGKLEAVACLETKDSKTRLRSATATSFNESSVFLNKNWHAIEICAKRAWELERHSRFS